VGIVGVPWQDVAHPDSFEGESLRLLSAEELAQPDAALMGRSRWDLMLGAPGSFAPMDPHMLEQIEQRPEGAQHPLLSGPEYAIAPAASSGRPNAINGHEQNAVAMDDLQYACTFQLREPVPCDPPAATGNDVSCQCNVNEYEYSRSLCSYPNGTENEGVQEYDKAYPGTRQLEVLRGLGSQAVVGSICPKNTVPVGSPESDVNYGYNPVVTSIFDRLSALARPGCLERELRQAEDGSLACRLIQALPPGDCGCDPARGERELSASAEDAEVSAAMRESLERNGVCGTTSGVDCASTCFCEIVQLTGAERQACVMGAETTAGFCYVDSGPLVEQCPATARRTIRMPAVEPRAGASVSVVCGGE
jgi:hypothetical protein